MKLARPDIFHPRIVLAGDRAPAAGDAGAGDLIEALRNRGLHARRLPWDDPATVDADLVILCGPCDHASRPQAFAAWTRRVRKLLNPPAALAWSAGRHYLRDLQDAGVPVAAQPASGATTALVFFGGAQSHAFGAGGAEPDFALWDVGYAALRAAAERLGSTAGELLYARADVVGDAGDARLAGLDLIAPNLGWDRLGAVERADGQRRFACCVESALLRFGLGPLSHRRP